ncbi:hypothetical protein [Kaarinaea lacus]
MKMSIEQLKSEIRQAMNALAFAHHGEMLSPVHKSRILADERYPQASNNSMSIDSTSEHTSNISTSTQVNSHADDTVARKRVVLALNSKTQASVLRYAIEAADRFDAQLDIVSNLDENQVKMEMTQKIGHAASNWNLVPVNGDLLAGIAEHTRQHPEVIFIVTSDQDPLTQHYVATGSVGSVAQVPWLLVADERRVA